MKTLCTSKSIQHKLNMFRIKQNNANATFGHDCNDRRASLQFEEEFSLKGYDCDVKDYTFYIQLKCGESGLIGSKSLFVLSNQDNM